MLLLIGVSNFFDTSALKLPASFVSRVIMPLQSTFGGLTNSMSGYLRRVKLRTNL